MTWRRTDSEKSVGRPFAQSIMLLQADGEEILIAPALPEGWDVECKLHAPGNTTVEATIRNGKVQDLKVTPAERAKHVVSLLNGKPR